MEITRTNIQPNQFILAKTFLKIMRSSVAIEPILINLLAIALATGILSLLNYPALFPKLGNYHRYFIYFMEGLIFLQTLKSARKSLCIPLLAISIASIGILLLTLNPHWEWVSLDTLKKLMLLGVLGVAASIFVMR